MEKNGKTEHRLTSVEKDVEYIRATQDKNHKELMSEFKALREKVNEEITTMQDTIKNNKVFLMRLLVGVVFLGSFIWIQESRNAILSIIGFVT